MISETEWMRLPTPTCEVDNAVEDLPMHVPGNIGSGDPHSIWVVITRNLWDDWWSAVGIRLVREGIKPLSILQENFGSLVELLREDVGQIHSIQ